MMRRRHMFHWLPGLPGSVRTELSSNSDDKTFIVKLADPNMRGKPRGTKWAVEIHDKDRSWYVAYRGCTGYDWKAPVGWCGKIQISHRDDGSTRAHHHAFLSDAGESISFGTSNFVTVASLESVPRSLRPGDEAFIRVRVRVNRALGA